MNNFNNANIDSYRCSRVLTSQTDAYTNSFKYLPSNTGATQNQNERWLLIMLVLEKHRNFKRGEA